MEEVGDERKQVGVVDAGSPWMKPNGHLGSYDISVDEKAEQDILDYHESQHMYGSEFAACRNWHDGQIPDSGNIEGGNPAFWDLPNECENEGGPQGHVEQCEKPCYGRHTKRIGESWTKFPRKIEWTSRADGLEGHIVPCLEEHV